MNIPLFNFVLVLLLAVMYLPLIFFTIQRREDGQSLPAWLVVSYALLAMVLSLTEAFWKNGLGDPQGLQELQHYGTLTLIFLMIMIVKTFLKEETWWGWVGFWAFWVFSLALLLTNALNLPEVLWSNGNIALQRSRLGPAWAILGWLIFAISLILAISNANRQARQQLFRNRLSYWWPAFFLAFINDFLLFSNHAIPGSPLRLFATAFMAYVVVTHDLPDLRLFL